MMQSDRNDTWSNNVGSQDVDINNVGQEQKARMSPSRNAILDTDSRVTPNNPVCNGICGYEVPSMHCNYASKEKCRDEPRQPSKQVLRRSLG